MSFFSPLGVLLTNSFFGGGAALFLASLALAFLPLPASPQLGFSFFFLPCERGSEGASEREDMARKEL